MPASGTADGSRPASRRSPLVLAALGAVCGLGLVVSGVTLVRAADDSGMLEFLRADYLRSLAMREKRQPAPAPQVARRPVAQPRLAAAAPRHPVPRKARLALSVQGERLMSSRTVCVRTCDGYAFPLGTLQSRRDIRVHQEACQAACPGAKTALYTLAPGQMMESSGLARSTEDGSLYRRLPTAFLFQKTRVASCSCQGPDNVATRLSVLLDPTLRAGDVVVDGKGEAKVFAGDVRVPHSPRAFTEYRKSRAVGRVARAQIDRAMGTSQKEALARDFQRSLRQAGLAAGGTQPRPEAPVTRVATRAEPRMIRAEARYAALREVAAPAGSAAHVRVFSLGPADGAGSSAPRIIQVR